MSLKIRRGIADAHCMLRRIPEPLALSEASLLALRPAMNAPVLNVDFLPVGPARAAIVVFAEEYGGIGLAFGLRSTEGGQVAVFKNREPIDDSASISDLLEPALASAERMGFLFDEDMIADSPGGNGRSEATALWGRLMGDIAMPPPPKAAPPLPAATEPILDLTEALPPELESPELVLDEVAPLTSELSETATLANTAAPAPRRRAARPKPAEIDLEAPLQTGDEDLIETERELLPPATAKKTGAAPALSKFRKPAQAVASKAGAPRGESESTDDSPHIGRVSLVRVRRNGDGTPQVPYLARLLSSF